jgi:hypothetical protein
MGFTLTGDTAWDIINHLDENTVVVADKVGLEPRHHANLSLQKSESPGST